MSSKNKSGMDATKVKRNAVFAAALLLVLSVSLALFAAEIAVRALRPDMKYAAESLYRENRSRIFANIKNALGLYPHPDTGRPHVLMHNSLGLRQHREFSPDKPPQTVRIGIFGDSFVENVRIPVQFSFTEPLDYLLNRAGDRVEVLNFGTDGYGTDQVYLQYMEDGRKAGLDAVVYLYCENDLSDILANRLIDLDADGNIKYLPVQPPSLFISVVKKFYLTYFVLEAFGKWITLKERVFMEKPDENAMRDSQENRDERKRRFELLAGQLERAEASTELKDALEIFTVLTATMKKAAMVHSARFYVALFPGFKTDKKGRHNQTIKNVLESQGIDVLDLFPFFRAVEQEYPASLYFQNDGHWNEEGNKMATVAIFKFLAEKLKVGGADDRFVREGLYEYYSAFPPGPVGDAWLEKKPVDGDLQRRIAARYLAIEPESVESAAAFLAANPDSAGAYARRGNAHYARGMYDRAVRDFDKAIELDPAAWDVYNSRGVSHLNMNNVKMALADFQKACDAGNRPGCNSLEIVSRMLVKNKPELQ